MAGLFDDLLGTSPTATPATPSATPNAAPSGGLFGDLLSGNFQPSAPTPAATPAPAEAAPTERPGLLSLVGRGTAQGLSSQVGLLTEAMQGFVAQAAGNEEEAKRLFGEYQARVAAHAKTNEDFVTEIENIRTPGDAARWVAFNAGQFLGDVVPSLAIGAVTGGAGTIAARGASIAAGRTIGAAAGRRAAEAGVVGSMIGSNVGESAAGIYEAGGTAQEDAAIAATAGVAKGVLDASGLGYVLRRSGLVGPAAERAVTAGILRRMGREVPAAMAVEGLTEGAQEAIDKAVQSYYPEGHPFWTSETALKLANAAAGGTVGGFLGGTAAAAAQGLRTPPSQTVPPPPPGAPSNDAEIPQQLTTPEEARSFLAEQRRAIPRQLDDSELVAYANRFYGPYLEDMGQSIEAEAKREEFKDPITFFNLAAKTDVNPLSFKAQDLAEQLGVNMENRYERDVFYKFLADSKEAGYFEKKNKNYAFKQLNERTQQPEPSDIPPNIIDVNNTQKSARNAFADKTNEEILANRLLAAINEPLSKTRQSKLAELLSETVATGYDKPQRNFVSSMSQRFEDIEQKLKEIDPNSVEAQGLRNQKVALVDELEGIRDGTRTFRQEGTSAPSQRDVGRSERETPANVEFKRQALMKEFLALQASEKVGAEIDAKARANVDAENSLNAFEARKKDMESFEGRLNSVSPRALALGFRFNMAKSPVVGKNFRKYLNTSDWRRMDPEKLDKVDAKMRELGYVDTQGNWLGDPEESSSAEETVKAAQALRAKPNEQPQRMGVPLPTNFSDTIPPSVLSRISAMKPGEPISVLDLQRQWSEDAAGRRVRLDEVRAFLDDQATGARAGVVKKRGDGYVRGATAETPSGWSQRGLPSAETDPSFSAQQTAMLEGITRDIRRNQVEGFLGRMLKGLGVNVEFKSSLRSGDFPGMVNHLINNFSMTKEQAEATVIAGAWNHNRRLITIALDDKKITATAFHEGFHALEDLGFTNQKDFDLLAQKNREAKVWYEEQFKEQGFLWDDLPAKEQRAWTAQMLFETPTDRSVGAKLRRFFENLKNWINGLGWTNVENLIADLKNGVVAGRAINTKTFPAKPMTLDAAIRKLYHGTAATFNRFSLEFIDTGEGAQVKGPGLYLTEAYGIGRGYRDQDRQRKGIEVEYEIDNGKLSDQAKTNLLYHINRHQLDMFLPEVILNQERFVKELKQDIKDNSNVELNKERLVAAQQDLKELKKFDKKQIKSKVKGRTGLNRTIRNKLYQNYGTLLDFTDKASFKENKEELINTLQFSITRHKSKLHNINANIQERKQKHPEDKDTIRKLENDALFIKGDLEGYLSDFDIIKNITEADLVDENISNQVGGVYHVSLDIEDDEFVDIDVPISAYFDDGSVGAAPDYELTLPKPKNKVGEMIEKLLDNAYGPQKLGFPLESVPTMNITLQEVIALGNKKNGPAIRQFMLDNGIVAFRFRAAGSRRQDVTNPKHNWVVFDDTRLNIDQVDPSFVAKHTENITRNVKQIKKDANAFGMLRRNFHSLTHLAEVYPVLKPLQQLFDRDRALQSELVNTSYVAASDLMKFTPERRAEITKMMALLDQVEQDPQVINGQIRVGAMTISDPAEVKFIVDMNQQFIRLWESAVGALTKNVYGIDPNDPATSNAKTFRAAKEYSRRLMLQRRKGYVPHIRVGDYFAAVYDDKGNTLEYVTFDAQGIGASRNPEKETVDYLRQKYPGKMIDVNKRRGIEDTRRMLQDASLIDKLIQLSIDSNLKNEEAKKEIQRLMDSLREKKELAFSNVFTRKRKNIPGWLTPMNEQSYLQDALPRYFTGAAKAVSRLHMNKPFNNIVNGYIDASGQRVDGLEQVNPRMAEYARELYDYVLGPSTGAGTFKSIAFHWQLGFAVDSALVNMAQLPTGTFPHLSAFGNPAKAMMKMLKAMGDFTTKSMSKNMSTNFVDYQKLIAAIKQKDPKLAEHLLYLQESGLLSPIYGEEIRTQVDVTKMGYSPGLNDKINKTLQLSTTFFSYAEQFNRVVTAMTAYEMTKDPNFVRKFNAYHERKGWTVDPKQYEDPALKIMAESIARTQFTGAEYDRPRFTRANPYLEVFTQFMPVMVKLTENYWKNVVDVIKDPEVRVAAGRMLLFQTLAITAVAGMFGAPLFALLPLVFDLALYMSSGGIRHDFKQDVSDFVNWTLGKDIGTMFMNGMGANPITSLNLSTRADQNIIRPDTLANFGPENMFGPAGSSILNVPVNLYKAMSEGRTDWWVLAAALMPRALANTMRAYGYTEEGIRTQAGDTVIARDNVEPYTAQMRAAGFTTMQDSDARRHVQNVRFLNGRARDAKEAESERLAKLLFAAISQPEDTPAYNNALDRYVREFELMAEEDAKQPDPSMRLRIDPKTIQKRARNMMQGSSSEESITRALRQPLRERAQEILNN